MICLWQTWLFGSLAPLGNLLLKILIKPWLGLKMRSCGRVLCGLNLMCRDILSSLGYACMVD